VKDCNCNMKTLLVEIVTEEIPAGYVAPALQAMADIMAKSLSQARIAHGKPKTFGTPRRLAILVPDMEERQTSISIEVVGPPKRVAFDAEGHATKAAEGFANTQGVPVRRLTVKTTPKGEYVCVKKTERGQTTPRLLQTIIPDMIKAIPFPKSMRWANRDLSFARPIHAVVALLDDRVIPFKLEDVRSGRRTLGHRFLHPKAVTLRHASDYASALESAFVVADVAERKKRIETEVATAASTLGGRVLCDDELVDTVTNLVEYVAVSAGTFDRNFLQVPSEVLITAMRQHQKYFAVVDDNGGLLPCFIAVNNTPAKDMAVITSGHERVLRARLEDARFFFESDGKTPLSEMVERLRGVMFQAKLGSMFEKMTRAQKMAEHLAGLLAPDLKATVSRAAWLSKSDLTSQMVMEFPKLQGIMGRVYALRAGEPEAVAQAIEEHYLPTHAGGTLPSSLPGALVSIADKLDSICSCFGIGLAPTGTADPYALRRQALGIIQIVLARNLSVSLSGLIRKSLELLDGKISEDPAQTCEKVLAFFQYRMEYLLAEQGFAKDLISAVTSVSIDDLPAVSRRTAALQELKAKPDFEPLAVAFKRVVNIIKQATQRGDLLQDGRRVTINPGLFQESCEQTLYDAFEKVKQDTAGDVTQQAFDRALLKVATLKGPIDGFFDGVMVLTDDQRLKQNRLALLGEIAELFAVFADFSKIST
jgi:glycyl-tRNA synthetase beta chain